MDNIIKYRMGYKPIEIFRQMERPSLLDFFELFAIAFIVLSKETKTESAITAGLWFATVTFKSGTRCSREFILDSLKLCYESGMADDIIPNWHSYGIFTPVSAFQLHSN